MSQSKVTDYFNAARKNIHRNGKIVRADNSPLRKTVDKNAKILKRTRQPVEIKRGKQSSLNEDVRGPAFKRFRHLLDGQDERSDTITETSSSKTRTEEKSKDEIKLSGSDRLCQVRQTQVSDNLNLFETSSNRSEVSNNEKIIQSKMSPSSSSCNIGQIKHKSISMKSPAHERFHHLISSTSIEKESTISEIKYPTLPMPHFCKTLIDFFKAMDNVANMIYNRKELLTFSTLQSSVKKVVRRDFDEDNFGQIRMLYKGCFSLRYEKNIPKFGRVSTNTYELVVDPNLINDETHMSKSKETARLYNGSRLIQRRETFLVKVMEMLMAKHTDFLCKELNLSSSDIPSGGQIKRWHPLFRLEKVEPPVPEPMPPRPDADEQRITSAKDAVKLFRRNGLLKEAALCQSVASKSEGDTKEDINNSNQKPITHSETRKQAQLKSVSKSLLERIRAKEAAKVASVCNHGGPDWEKRQEMLSRLPELAVHTWNLFAISRKPVLPVNHLCEKIADSHPSGLSESRILDHLRLLAESLPAWFELLEWKIPHARILNMKQNLAQVRGSLTKLIDENYVT